jgi:hypothetical protein
MYKWNYGGWLVWVLDVIDLLLIKFFIFIRYWKKWEFNEIVFHLFIDFKKSCDWVRRKVICCSLMEFKVLRKTVRLIEMCLHEKYSKVRIIIICLWFCMGAKLGLWHWGRYIGRGLLQNRVLRRIFGMKRIEVTRGGENCILRGLIICTLRQV